MKVDSDRARMVADGYRPRDDLIPSGSRNLRKRLHHAGSHAVMIIILMGTSGARGRAFESRRARCWKMRPHLEIALRVRFCVGGCCRFIRAPKRAMRAELVQHAHLARFDSA